MNVLNTERSKRMQTISDFVNKYLPKYGMAPKSAIQAAELFVKNFKSIEKKPMSTTNGRIIWDGDTYEIRKLGSGAFDVIKL